MTTTLIAGANEGLGFDAARRLIDAGQDVWIGARDPERGQAADDEAWSTGTYTDRFGEVP
jgi:NAD(P)-dependent dehydrogenase (short-subunit alcohol dehydrogenase family)